MVDYTARLIVDGSTLCGDHSTRECCSLFTSAKQRNGDAVGWGVLRTVIGGKGFDKSRGAIKFDAIHR
jgi:hypothetical protein